MAVSTNWGLLFGCCPHSEKALLFGGCTRAPIFGSWRELRGCLVRPSPDLDLVKLQAMRGPKSA